MTSNIKFPISVFWAPGNIGHKICHEGLHVTLEMINELAKYGSYNLWRHDSWLFDYVGEPTLEQILKDVRRNLPHFWVVVFDDPCNKVGLIPSEKFWRVK